MPVTTVDEYMAGVPESQLAALESLRQIIKATVPDATEYISYGTPGYKTTRSLVSFGSAKSHCSFFVQSPAVMQQFADELKDYSTAAGTVRFTPDKPIPADLVQRLIKARLEENAALDAKKKRR